MSCDLLINGTAALRSSRGVARFYGSVMHHLHWPGRVEILKPAGGPFRRPLELLLRGRRDAILWSPSHRGPLNAHHHVVSVHDCINVEYVYRDDWRLSAFRRLFGLVLGRAEAIVALSVATRDAILRNYEVDPGKIVVIPAGFEALRPEPGAAPPPDDGPFILLVTNGLPHKNTEGVAFAFVRSRASALGIRLRIVGRVSPRAEAELRKARAPFEICSGVSDATLLGWYQRCLFLLAPSLEEGYDLPIAEALASGANVLCSDIAVHREFFAGHAEFFNPRTNDGMIAAIDEALERDRPWHPRLLNPRDYRAMADDYRQLFQRIEARLPFVVGPTGDYGSR